MSDQQLDLSRNVPPNYPDLVAWKQRVGCPDPPERCPAIPCYTKNFFCSEWGDKFKCICPQDRPFRMPFRGVREELSGLDFFTRLPDNPHLHRPYPQEPDNLRFRSYALKYALDDVNDCPMVAPRWSRLCPENQKEFSMIHHDTICGLCLPPERAKCLPQEPGPDCSDEPCQTMEDLYDLPFRVKVGAWPQDLEKKPKIKKTGVSHCLHPSSLRDLQTVTRDSFRNVYKMVPKDKLKYYRSPLAIDVSRPRLTLPSHENDDIVLAGPLCVNATPMVMRPKGQQKFPKHLGPNFQVIVQGPICI